MLPPRCFTCNNFIGHKWNMYVENKNQSQFYGKLLDDMGMHRICCRRMFLTHVEIIDDIVSYSSSFTTLDESRTTLDALNKNTRTISCD